MQRLWRQVRHKFNYRDVAFIPIRAKSMQRVRRNFLLIFTQFS